MATATYVVQVAWDGSTFGGTANDTITSYVTDISTSSGRSLGGMLGGRATAGTADIMVRNFNGEFSPLHSAYIGINGSATTMPVRVQADSSTIWQGFIEDIEPSATIDGLPYARINCVGPFSEISAKVASVAPSGDPSGLIHVQIGKVLDAISWAAGARSLSTSSVSTGYWQCDHENALDALQKLVNTEIGFLYESVDGKVVFEHRQYREETARCTVSQATFSDAAGSTLSYSGISTGSLAAMRREQYDHVTMNVTTSIVGDNIILWNGITANGSLPMILPGATISFVAQLPSGLTGFDPGNAAGPGRNQNAAVDDTGALGGHLIASSWESAEVFGSLGNADDVTATIVTASCTPTTCALQLTNNDATFPARDYSIVVHGVPAFIADPIQSTGGTGERDYPFPGQWFRSLDDANAAIAWILSHSAQPRPLFTLDLKATRNATQLAQCIARTISDRITITATGARTMMSNASYDVFIEAIRHHISMSGGVHETSWDCSAVNTLVPDTRPYGRWDIGKWDDCRWG